MQRSQKRDHCLWGRESRLDHHHVPAGGERAGEDDWVGRMGDEGREEARE